MHFEGRQLCGKCFAPLASSGLLLEQIPIYMQKRFDKQEGQQEVTEVISL